MMRAVAELIIQNPSTTITTRILGKRQWALRQRELREPHKGGREEGEKGTKPDCERMRMAWR